MKANYGTLVSKFAGIVGLTGVSLLTSLPSGASEVVNNHAHNQIPGIQTNFQSLPTDKGNSKVEKQIAQRGGSATNPRPSIFNEPPYNRSRTQPVPSTPRPGTRPTKPVTIPPTGTTSTKNVVALAESNSSFKTLTKALKLAGLTEVLQGPGPFTIFAPTDAAFAKLPPDALRDLLLPENKEVLVKVLTYHVVSGKVLSTDLKSGQVTSLQGDPITVKVEKETGVTINDAKVTKPDIQGSNGVIHQIDNVILPPSL
jgi:uncharacterized surface protein with fasciclin (FAS1) repeats